jgi:hypothetical protein
MTLSAVDGWDHCLRHFAQKDWRAIEEGWFNTMSAPLKKDGSTQRVHH